MLFSGGRQRGEGRAAIYQKTCRVRVQPAAIKRVQLAQDCQRRHSQASRAPVWLTVCFLVKNME
jgi:hypothetical protein